MRLRPGLGATYRLQLGPRFGFADAAAAVAYLARLGVETVYLSPVAEAVPGSSHGYDGTDPTSLRAELGGEPGYAALVEACVDHGLGLCVDHVPNHLATWHRGPWWRRLLAEGPASDMAEVFDVDWDAGPPASRGKVALPLLDRGVHDAVAEGLVRVEVRAGEPVVVVGPPDDEGIDLPVAKGSATPDDAGAAGSRGSGAADLVTEILSAQHYRLVAWHDARDRNYRRFFDIDGLVGVRVECDPVFERTHALVIRLAEAGWISALRVDHVDGLREPTRYLERLRAATCVPVVVEKILTEDETLRPDWPVVGTTGYETIDDVGGVLVDPHGLDRLVAAGRSDGDAEVGALTVECRRLVATTSFPGEIARAAQRLGVRTDAFREVAVRLGRYRTYLDGGDTTAGAEGAEGAAGAEGAEGDAGAGEAAELGVWEKAVAAGRDAAASAAADGEAAGDGEVPAHGGAAAVVRAVADPAKRSAVLGAQQLTGALMAKGIEDTAWYRLCGPLAFCEVGGDPGRSRHDAVVRWHARAAERATRHLHGLVPGTTHDTKRAQDVRCRLYALSEMAAEFGRGLWALRDAVAGTGAADGFAFETRVAAQLALGMLPPLAGASGRGEITAGGEQGASDGRGAVLTRGGTRVAAGGAGAGADAGTRDVGQVAVRLAEALVKGAREAKKRSSWTSPDPSYEEVLRELAHAVLERDAELLVASFGPVLDEAIRLGAVNSLSATVLRHTVPGIPDCYQGDEVWNLSLVDPDNRRPVDFGALAVQLDDLDAAQQRGAGGAELAAELRRSWRDGRVKHYVTAACLRARRGPGGAALAPGASYQPLAATGPAAGSVLSFARTTAAAPLGADRRSVRRVDGGARAREAWAIAVVTRLPGRLDAAGDDLPAGASYAGTTLPLPDGAPHRFVDAFTGSVATSHDGALRVERVLGSLPVALLVAGPAVGSG